MVHRLTLTVLVLFAVFLNLGHILIHNTPLDSGMLDAFLLHLNALVANGVNERTAR